MENTFSRDFDMQSSIVTFFGRLLSGLKTVAGLSQSFVTISMQPPRQKRMHSKMLITLPVCFLS